MSYKFNLLLVPVLTILWVHLVIILQMNQPLVTEVELWL